MIGPKKSSPKNGNRLQFYKDIPLKVIWQKKNQPSNFYIQIPLEPNRTKKNHQKIEIAFNFKREISSKINRTKILHRVPF